MCGGRRGELGVCVVGGVVNKVCEVGGEVNKVFVWWEVR